MSEKIIINELLTFVQNKIDRLDDLSIIQICCSNFKDKDIESAKSVLYSNITDGSRIITRKGEDKNKKNLQDIIKLFKETESDHHPVFVAKDLDRLPPVTFDHIDVSRFLKDIAYLKNQLALMQTDSVSKSELLTLESSLRSDISDVRACVKQAAAKSKNDTQSSSSKNGSRNGHIVAPSTCHVIDNNNTCDRAKIPLDDSECAQSKTGCPVASAIVADNVSKPATARNTYEFVSSRPTYRDITLTQSSRDTRDMDNRSVVDETEFTTVTRHRRPRKPKNIRGTLKCTNNRLEAAESVCAIYLSRCKKHITVDDVRAHINEIGENCLAIELLNQWKETTFNSFKIEINSSRISKFLSPESWPVGLVCRRYRERSSANRNSSYNK